MKWLSVAGVLLVGVSNPAHALFGDDEARKAILDLRARVQTLSETMAEKNQTMQAAQLELVNQIESLKANNAQLVGQIETLTNQLTLQQRAVRDLYTNLDKRLVPFEAKTVQLDGKTLSVQPEEKRRYDLGLVLFSEGKYRESSRLLDSLLADYPKSGYAPSALYWLGNTQFALGQLKESIATQDQLIELYPDSVQVPEALLSKAASLASLGQKRQAANTLEQIKKRYPGTEVADLAEQRLKALGPIPAQKKQKANVTAPKQAAKAEQKPKKTEQKPVKTEQKPKVVEQKPKAEEQKKATSGGTAER